MDHLPAGEPDVKAEVLRASESATEAPTPTSVLRCTGYPAVGVPRIWGTMRVGAPRVSCDGFAGDARRDPWSAGAAVAAEMREVPQPLG